MTRLRSVFFASWIIVLFIGIFSVFFFSRPVLAACDCTCTLSNGATTKTVSSPDVATCTKLCSTIPIPLPGVSLKSASCTESSGSSGAAKPVIPSTTCDCYCATSAGAVKQDTKVTPSGCFTSCKSKGQTVAACAFNATQSPDRSSYCYTEDQCKKQNGIFDTKQAWDCLNGQHYCFPNPANAAKANLNVSIPNPADPSKPLTLTGNIGEYINAIFSFMINAGIVFAIVMVMIGGLQYTIGAATQDKGKGKDRMKNGVTGLVLLLCVNLIASTVNPYLIRLKVPEFPMIKPIGLPGVTESCEGYKSKKDDKGNALYKLEPTKGTESCGDSANVLAADGQPAVAAGITCDYLGCPDEKQCLGIGDKATCLSCSEVVANNSSKLAPSSQVCSKADAQLKKKDSDSGGFPNQRNYCFFSRDLDILFTSPTFNATAITALLGAVPPFSTLAGTGWAASDIDTINQGSCVEMTINCSAMTKCDDYDDVNVTGGSHTTDLDNIDNTSSIFGDLNLEKICNADPCHLQERLKLEGPCKFDKKSVLNPKNDACDNP